MADLKNKLANKAETAKNGEGKVVLTPQKEMESLLSKMTPQIQKAVGKVLDPDRVARIALSAWNGDRRFWECDRMSFLSALMKGAQAGLEVNSVLQEAYLIPYGNQVQFQLGYHGILSLCHRTKQFASIYAREVYKNDKFEYSYGLEQKLEHVPADSPEGQPTHYYAVYKLKDGGYDFVVWSRDRVIKHAKQYSKTYSKSGSAWQTSFDSMARKTVLIDVLKYAPKSVEMAQVMSADESVGSKDTIDPEAVDYAPVTDVEFTEVEAQKEADSGESQQNG